MSWQADAEAHALKDAPRESCGLVLKVAGAEIYRPCRNVAERDSEFVLPHEDWAAAEDLGDVVAVVHSHPGMTAHPSEHDRISCNASGLPWHIVGLPDLAWITCEPVAGRPPLLGRTFVHGVQDCYSLIRDYYAEVLRIDLPDFIRSDRWWDRGEDLYRRHFQEAGFVEVKAERAAAEHDVVILQLGNSSQPNHGGVLLADGQIMHHCEHNLSCRGIYGGFWKKATVLTLRHRSLAGE